MKKKIFIWASDISNNTGEGQLARNFINDLGFLNDKRIILKTFESYYKIKVSEISRIKNLNNKIINKSFSHKYIGPLYGIVNSWFYFICGYKIFYINYLPLWNFFPFLMLPPKSILGPITGSVYTGKKKFSLNTRNIVFPILYFINSYLIRFRFKKIIFSTNLLNEYFPKRKNYFFNYVVTFLNHKFKVSKKKIDLVYYYRKHDNKNNKNILRTLKELNDQGLKIYIIGNRLKISNIKNFGYVSNDKVLNILKNSKATLSSAENLYSIFNIDSLNNNLKVFFDLSLIKFNNPKFSENLIPIDFENKKNAHYIRKMIKQNNQSKVNMDKLRRLNIFKRKFNYFIKYYF
tara:strand:- start:2206 stop:3246 length:1041 start_codon:yes stop_codon:yes gene_type:complete